jgi:glycosyltransferase involved in cell wall biosynthesis/peptidoglycan/xylan/chitin deacetylase (PgdA/CDA1 family)
MRLLSREYDVVSADEVIDAQTSGRPLPPRPVLITFDDGYHDFAEVAWPILRKYQLPVTVFVPTAYPDDPWRRFWWDRLREAIQSTRQTQVFVPEFGRLALGTPAARYAAFRAVCATVKRLPHGDAMRAVDQLSMLLGEALPLRTDVLSWTQLRALASQGVTVGAHTRTHPALTRMTLEEARTEIVGSRDDIAWRLDRTPRVFAYPFGDHDDRVAALVHEAGFALAVTCVDGHNPPGADPLRLCRTNITRRTRGPVFRFRLTRAGAALDRWRHHSVAPAMRKASPPDRPRVAYVMSRFPKLSETFVLNEIRTMAALGVPLEIHPLLRERQAAAHPEVAAWAERARYGHLLAGETARAHLHFLLRQPRRYIASGLEALGGTWGSRRLFIGALGTWPRAVRFAYEMQREGVTHVHAHFATHPALAALVVHRLTDLPFSFTAHGSDLHVDRRMLPRKVQAATFVTTVSRFNRDVILRECGERSASRIHVVHCGVDPRCFTPVARDPEQSRLRLACVASLERVKGHTYLIQACRLLRDRGVPVSCHLAGDGPMRRMLERQIERLELTEHVLLLGPRTRPDVVRLLSESDIAVLASHPTRDGRREGIPVALMEAMAAGLPVVATAISGIPELVDDGVTGLLVPSGDARALADALARLAADHALRQRMGRAGRARVLAEFELETTTRELLTLIAPGVVPPRVTCSPALAPAMHA